MAPVQLFGAHVSVNLFTVLSVQAATGRTFRHEDGQLTNVSPIVVSQRLVRSGLVSGRLGDRVEFKGASYRLIGTMPDTFWFPDRQTSFWVPVLVVQREEVGTGTYTTLRSTIARLRTGNDAGRRADPIKCAAIAGRQWGGPGGLQGRVACVPTDRPG